MEDDKFKASGNNKSILIIDFDTHMSLSIIRSLGQRGIDVYLISNNKFDMGQFSRYLTKGYVYPQLREPENLVNFVLKILNKHKIKYVISSDEQVILALNKHREKIEKTSRLMFPKGDIFELAIDKRKTYQIAEKLNIPYPKTIIINKIEELEQYRNLNLPVIVKPSSRNYKDHSQLNMNFKREYVNDFDSLYNIFKKFNSKFNFPLIQEYCHGEEIGFPILMYGGKCVACSQYKILRTVPINGGVSVYRETVKVDPILKDYSIRLLKAMNWEGIAEIDYIYNKKDNTIKLLEVNGRFWIALSLAIYSGIDYPYILYKCYSGESIPEKIDCKIGMKGRMVFFQIAWLREILNRKKIDGRVDNLPTKSDAISEFVKSFNPKVKDDILSLKDPIPGIIKIIQYFKFLPEKDNIAFNIRIKD